jgi:hypothetical protein
MRSKLFEKKPVDDREQKTFKSLRMDSRGLSVKMAVIRTFHNAYNEERRPTMALKTKIGNRVRKTIVKRDRHAFRTQEGMVFYYRTKGKRAWVLIDPETGAIVDP